MKCWLLDFFVFLQNIQQTVFTTSFSTKMETPKLIPARNFGPGYFIREQMEYRNWTEDDLACALKLNDKDLRILLENIQPITIDIANVLANVFETSYQYWMNLDFNYRKNSTNT